MNLILFEQSEVKPPHEGLGESQVTISSADRRFIHCTTILKIDSKSVVRLGVIDADMYDARVSEITSDHITFAFSDEKKRKIRPYSDLNISLILACPRPKVLGRLFPVFSQLGFRRLMLINVEKVEFNYFGFHWMKKD